MPSARIVYPALAVLVFLASGGLLGLDGLFHDDTAWLISSYDSASLAEFLDTGFNQLRRPLMGTFLYLFLGLHKALPSAMAHLLWDLSIMGATLGAAIVLFHLARRLLGGGTLAPAIAAALLAVHPIDTTLPVYSQVVYRIGVLLALLSLLLTHMAVAGRDRRRLLLGIAVVLSAAGSFVFIEGVVAYEAARLAMVYGALGEGGAPGGRGARLRRTAILSSPFLASALALVVLKLAYPTTGLYTGTYAMSAANLLSADKWAAILKAAFLASWTHVLPHGLRYGLFPLMIGLAGAAILYILLARAPVRARPEEGAAKDERSRSLWTTLVGLLLFLPPALLYLLVGKAPTPGVESRHGTVLEPGWALTVGGLAAIALSLLAARGRSFGRAVALMAALVVGLGVFASNVSIDIYQETFDREMRFWEALATRFPTLPEHAPVIFDIELGGPEIPSYRTISACYYYQLEFPLNLLYATSRTPGEFRTHPGLERVFPFFGIFLHSDKVTTMTFWGKTHVFPRRAVFVHYRDGELLVNDEIAARYKGLPYQALLDRPVPKLPPPPPGGYPYRDRMTRFFVSPDGS
jgi:hypothetical protein